MPRYGQDGNMVRPDYEPKASARTRIADILAAHTDDADSAVTILGIYGERGVVFYPANDPDDESAVVGFSLVGKNANPCHNNLSRDHAAALVAFLIDQYEFDVDTEEVQVTKTVTKTVVR